MKVTVVTAAYNAAATIADTLRSVEAQTHGEVEHIVVDGGSTDGTLAIVEREGRRVSRVVSGPDDGIYDAMNKGLALATGEAIGFLNADDWYATPQTLAHVVAAFAPGVDIVYGHLAQVEAAPPHRVKRYWREKPRAANAFACGWQPAHPSTFMRTALLREVGGFDPAMRISADYGVFARCFLGRNARAAFTPHLLTNMRLGGESTSGFASIVRGNRECVQALRACRSPLPWATIVMKLARKSLQARAAAAHRAEGEVSRE